MIEPESSTGSSLQTATTRPPASISADPSTHSELNIPKSSETTSNHVDVERILSESNTSLVLPTDRHLIPDALLVALAQLQVCRLTVADQSGPYKLRPINFVGLACQHCNGGQPGFGRYFPASVRSLAQTTTSATILKHMAAKCRFVPTNIRQAILSLQSQQQQQDQIPPSSSSAIDASARSRGHRPHYGTRKIFFDQLWWRLHGEATPTAIPPPTKGHSSLPAPTVARSSNEDAPETIRGSLVDF